MCGNPSTTSTAPMGAWMPQPLLCALRPPHAPKVATTSVNTVPLCQWCARPIAAKRLGVAVLTVPKEGGS